MNDLLLAGAFLARLTLGSALLLAGLTKWLDPAGLKTTLRRLRFFPNGSLSALTFGLALAESLSGVALLLNWFPQVAAAGSFVLLLAFTGFLVFQYRRGETQGCGCFGSAAQDRIGLRSFARNAVLLLLAAVVFLTPAETPNPAWLVAPLLIAVVALAKRLTRPRTSSQVSFLPSSLSRRDFLRRLGQTAFGLSGLALLERLAVPPAAAQHYCPCTQTYIHWEFRCGTHGCAYPLRRRHVFQRTCESCDCGCASSCRTDWCCQVQSCELADNACESITPNCGCACNHCNPCKCYDGC